MGEDLSGLFPASDTGTVPTRHSRNYVVGDGVLQGPGSGEVRGMNLTDSGTREAPIERTVAPVEFSKNTMARRWDTRVLLFAVLVQVLFLALLPSAYRTNDVPDYSNFYAPEAQNIIAGKGL